MAAIEAGPLCHPFRAGSNPTRENVRGSVRNMPSRSPLVSCFIFTDLLGSRRPGDLHILRVCRRTIIVIMSPTLSQLRRNGYLRSRKGQNSSTAFDVHSSRVICQYLTTNIVPHSCHAAISRPPQSTTPAPLMAAQGERGEDTGAAPHETDERGRAAPACCGASRRCYMR